MNSLLYSARAYPRGYPRISCCVFPPISREEPFKETGEEKTTKDKKKVLKNKKVDKRKKPKE